MKTTNYPKYFTFSELCVTNTGEKNTPKTFEQVFNLLILGYALDFIRSNFKRAIVVNSAFRTDDVNQAVGGVPTSYHLKGLAADIRPISVTQRMIVDTSLTKEEAEQDYANDIERLESILLYLYNEGRLAELIPYGNFFHIAISDKFKHMLIEKMFNDK